jgi:hypothetical protein
MSKENGFLEKLPELMQHLSEVKAEDGVPFDGTFQVDGGPFEVRLKPNATIGDLQRIANYSKEKRNKTIQQINS